MKNRYKSWIMALAMTSLVGLSNMMSAIEPQREQLLKMFKGLPEDPQRQVALFKIANFLLVPKTLAGHNNKISSVAIAGDKIVTGSWDNTAKIWDINTGQLLHTLVGHNSRIRLVVIAGDKVVTGSDDNTAKIWDIKTGKLPNTLVGHNSSVWSVAIAGDKVVTGSNDTTAKVWDIKTGKLLHTLAGHNNAIGFRSVAIAGDKIVTGSWDNTAKIWDINSGKLHHTLVSHNNSIRLVAIAGDKVVTGSVDKTAKIWDIKTGQLLHTLAGHNDEISSVAIAGDKVVTGSDDKTAKIWSLYINLNAPEFNTPGTALAWIVHNVTLPQADLIARAMRPDPRSMQENKPFVINMYSEDGKVFLSMPDYVRCYLLNRLNIELEIKKEDAGWLNTCVIL